MKKICKLITTFLSIIMFLSLTGCSNPFVEEEEIQDTSIVYILQFTDNFPVIEEDKISLFDNVLYDAAYTYGNVGIIVPDSYPSINTIKISEPKKDVTKNKRENLAENNVEIIKKELLNARADDEEVDILQAINLATDFLHSTDSQRKVVCIIASGLSTSGLLDMRSNNMLDYNPAFIVEQLKENYALPDLNDIEISWIGMGATAGSQKEISALSKHELLDEWNTILEKAGCSTLKFDSLPLSGKMLNEDLPYVTPIYFVEGSVDYESYSEADFQTSAIRFDETTLGGFIPDSYEFADRALAITALEKVANYLSENRDYRLVIAGSTASYGKEEDCQKLSLLRAESVKKLLIELGAESNQIDTIGLGRREGYPRVDDLDSSGHLTENAALNRAVFIYEPGSEVAMKING